MNNATTEKARIKLYLPAELYSQLEFRSNVDPGSMSAIVERAIANFLAQESEAEESDSKPDQERNYPDYDKLIEVNPNDYKAWYGRGVMLKNLGRYEEAIASLDKALEIKQDYYKAWYSRGNALYGLDFYEEAIASYEKAIELKHDLAQAWYEKGKALDKLGDREEAIGSCEKALEIQSEALQKLAQIASQKSDRKKVTLFLSPQLLRQLKIRAAIDSEPMPENVERALVFYLAHPEVVGEVDEVEEAAQSQTRRVYNVPESAGAIVLHDGELVSPKNQPNVLPEEDISVEKVQIDVSSSHDLRKASLCKGGGGDQQHLKFMKLVNVA